MLHGKGHLSLFFHNFINLLLGYTRRCFDFAITKKGGRNMHQRRTLVWMLRVLMWIGLGICSVVILYQGLFNRQVAGTKDIKQIVTSLDVNAIKYQDLEINKQQNKFDTGEATLAESVRKACSSRVKPSTKSRVLSTMQFIPGKKILYCPVEKIGTTFWRRVFYSLAYKHSQDKIPFDIPEETAQEMVKAHFSKSYSSALPADYFSFMFVRNPFSRLLSAFVDKIVAPNPYYWRQFGRLAFNKYRGNLNKSEMRGHDITFSDFVRLATDMESTTMYKDPHLKSIGTSCHPCHHKYDYIGRMENFKEDSLYVMRKIKTKAEIIETLEEQWDTLSTKASIEVNIGYWFDSKALITKYISWDKALQRFWLYMQMRGLIEKKIPLDVTKANADNITDTDFEKLAKEANKASNKVELSKQKQEVKVEAFASVEPSILQKFAKVFRNDFELYGYDTSPSYIFERGNRKIESHYLNYSHLN